MVMIVRENVDRTEKEEDEKKGGGEVRVIQFYTERLRV